MNTGFMVYDVVNITLGSLYCAEMFSGHNFYLFHQVLNLQGYTYKFGFVSNMHKHNPLIYLATDPEESTPV